MNKDALVEIFDLYAPVLYKYVFRLCRDALRADHIVGDVFTKLLGHLSAGTGPSTNLRSYLYEMAHHVVVDEMRYSQRSAPMEALYFRLQDAYSTDTSVETRVLFEAVWRAIKKDLTADQRHVVICVF
jgi:RNA polymerase sigma factor (sigma-70 family)